MFAQKQKQLTAHERVTVHKIFGHTMNWLEKYVEVAKYYPDWEQRKQIFNNEITRTDIIDNPEKAEKAFSTTLFGLRQALEESPFPSLRDELKEEYYKWISSVGIDIDNCPERLKQILFGINEILEGRGEKIMEDVINRKETTNINAPDYAERLNNLFSSAQIPLMEGRKQEKELKGKKGNEVDVNKRFGRGNKDKGEEVFKQIAGSVADRHGDFHFWKQKDQQSTNYEVDSSSHPTNTDEVVQDIKNKPQDWTIDEIPTEVNNFGWAKKQEVTAYCKHARIDDYDQQGKLNFNNNPIYRWESFNVQQRFEIKQVKGISGDYLTADEIKWVVREFKDNPGLWEIKKVDGQIYLVHNSAQIKNDEIGTLIHSQQKFNKAEWTEIDATLAKVNNIKQNARLEKVFVINKETGEKSEGEDWFIHSQLERKFDDKTGYLIYDSNAMIRAEDLSKGEQRAVGYKLEQEQVQHQDNRPRGGSGWLGHKANIYVAGSTMIISLIGLAFVK